MKKLPDHLEEGAGLPRVAPVVGVHLGQQGGPGEEGGRAGRSWGGGRKGRKVLGYRIE